jgi:hypothetical protein
LFVSILKCISYSISNDSAQSQGKSVIFENNMPGIVYI